MLKRARCAFAREALREVAAQACDQRELRRDVARERAVGALGQPPSAMPRAPSSRFNRYGPNAITGHQHRSAHHLRARRQRRQVRHHVGGRCLRAPPAVRAEMEPAAAASSLAASHSSARIRRHVERFVQQLRQPGHTAGRGTIFHFEIAQRRFKRHRVGLILGIATPQSGVGHPSNAMVEKIHTAGRLCWSAPYLKTQITFRTERAMKIKCLFQPGSVHCLRRAAGVMTARHRSGQRRRRNSSSGCGAVTLNYDIKQLQFRGHRSAARLHKVMERPEATGDFVQVGNDDRDEHQSQRHPSLAYQCSVPMDACNSGGCTPSSALTWRLNWCRPFDTSKLLTRKQATFSDDRSQLVPSATRWQSELLQGQQCHRPGRNQSDNSADGAGAVYAFTRDAGVSSQQA